MGTWVKETDDAIYLMQGNNWISRIQKKPSSSNPKERVLNVEGMRSWFTRSDFPMAMTVAIGAGGPEPQQAGGNGGSTGTIPPTGGGETGTGGGTSTHKGAKIKVKTTTYFKRQPKMASQLSDADKVLVANGTVLDMEYYIDVGNNHWQVELLNPTIGDKKTTNWFVYTPDIEVLTDVSLKVVSDTLFKAEPKLSAQLSDAQKIFVKNGTQYKLLNNQPAAGDHVEVKLADATLGPNKSNKWYVYQPDTKIEGKRQTLKVTGDTLFKTQPVQGSQLPNSDKVLVKKGTVFLINSYANPDKNHVKVALQGAFLGPKNLTTWYAYVPDIEIEGTELGNNPNDKNPGQPANPVDRGIPLSFPGFTGTYYSNDPIYPTNQYGKRGNFTWGEAVHANRSTGFYRKPANNGVVYGILNVAKVMEEIRKRYGDKPIQINSWYRDPATNAAVGGASQSRHLSGDAVDFVVPGVSCFDVFAQLDPWWGNRGGLASSSVFTHIDTRGYKARWDYGY
ncbi:MAG: D-Ala-D-Ala carboxypeptidase family metallohydrolase [Nodosilinea sp.]